jgi:hypothetical protein
LLATINISEPVEDVVGDQANVEIVLIEEEPVERREVQRLQPQRTVIGLVCHGGEPWSQAALIVDVSPSGISLLLNRPLLPQWLAVLELPDIECNLLGRVVHCMQQADGTWQAGLRLLQGMSRNDLKKLVAHLQ